MKLLRNVSIITLVSLALVSTGAQAKNCLAGARGVWIVYECGGSGIDMGGRGVLLNDDPWYPLLAY